MGGFRPAPVDTDIPTPKPFDLSDVRTAPLPQEERLPIGAGYSGKGGAVSNIADNFLRGWMQGLQHQEARKLQQANREVDSAKQIYSAAKQHHLEFASRDEVRKVSQKYNDWEAQNTGTLPNGVRIPIAPNAKPPLDQNESAILERLHGSEAGVEKAKNEYADTLQRYVAPEPGAKRPKGKGARGMPVIGHFLQAFAPNLTPEMLTAKAIESIRGEKIEAPGLSTEERLNRARLSEFEAGAPLRVKEREVTGAELDVRGKIAKNSEDLGKLYADKTLSSADKDKREAELLQERRAYEGKPLTPEERAKGESANIYLSTLNKVRSGLDPRQNPEKFDAAERNEFQRSFSYRPTTVDQVFLDKIGTSVRDPKTGQQRPYTGEDAIREMDKRAIGLFTAEEQARAKYQLNAFRMQWEYQGEARARELTGGARGYGQLTPQERVQVDGDLARAFKATPDERAAGRRPELSDKEKAAVPYNVLMGLNDDPKFAQFIKERKDNKGKATFPKILSPDEAAGFFGSKEKAAKDYGDFIDTWSAKLKESGLSDAEVNAIVAPYRRTQTHGSVTINPPPVVIPPNPYRQPQARP